MLTNSVAKVLVQLPALCDKLGMNERDRDGHILQGEDHRIIVDVGEIHMGMAHRLIFDVCGELREVYSSSWHYGESVRHTFLHLCPHCDKYHVPDSFGTDYSCRR